MRVFFLFSCIIVLPLIVVLSAWLFALSPPDGFVAEVRQELARREVHFERQRKVLKLRIDLLEYQNYLLLGVLSDAGLHEKIKANNLSLFPPEAYWNATDADSAVVPNLGFDALYAYYRRQPLPPDPTLSQLGLSQDDVKSAYSELAEPPYMNHYVFRNQWRLVAKLQAIHAFDE